MSIQNNTLPDNPQIEVIKSGKTGLFTNYIYKAIPLAFDESMSYYETLLGLLNYLKNVVIPTVNNNANAVSELQNLYIELKTYVDDYFTDLDVQEEINNKLDALVEDGTLTTLIGNYIQPLIDEQNQRITQIDNKINSATNGAPLVATSTSEMTDTDKIYVNTTNGYWYYYNGTTWTQGGIYQSSGISNKSITYNNLESELQDSFVQDTITTNYQIIKNKYINVDGDVIDLNNYSCYDINISPLQSYEIYVHYDTGSYGSDAICYVFLDNSNNIISSVDKASAISTGILDNNILHAIVESPYNATKLRINTTAGGSIQYNRILKVDKYIQNNIKKEQLDTKLQSFFNDEYTNVSPTLFKDGALFDGNRTWQSLNGYSIYEMNVEPNTKYQITIKQIYTNPIVIFSTPNYYTDKIINDITYRYQGLADYIRSDTSSAQFTDYEFITPNYCNKIYINLENGKSMTLKKSTSYDIKLEEIDMNYIKNQMNPLNNKTILFTGDSICAASTSGVKGWWRLIQENNPTANIYNYGVDGATIGIDPDYPTKNVVNYIQTMHTEHANADYIIIQGGVNDYWSSDIELGTFESNSNFNGETPYDTSTFSGALEWIFNYCLNNFGSKKVGYIVTQKINAGSNNFYQYMERAKEICKKWSIPYIDLFNDGDLNYFVTSQKQNYSITNVVPTGDGCHPNLAGYQIITPKIENWLKYKI